MSYLAIQDFKLGLDARRSILTSQIGVLEVGENLHINQGGQIQKRKKFHLLGTLPHGCFGLEATTAGLLTFTSRRQTAWTAVGLTRAAGTVTALVACAGGEHSYRAGDVITITSASQPGLNGTFTIVAVLSNTQFTYAQAGGGLAVADGVVQFAQTFLTGVTPQRLISYVQERYSGFGSGSGSATDNGPYPALTAVTHSHSFNGSAFVVSAFDAANAANRTFPASVQVHDAALALTDYNLGRVQETGKNGVDLAILLALDFSSYLGALGYTATQVDPVDPVGGANPTGVRITGPVDRVFDITATANDPGTGVSVSVTIPLGGTAEVVAQASFPITAWGAGAGTIRIRVNSIDLLLNTTLGFQTSFEQSVKNLTMLVNSGGTGYAAAFRPLTATSYTIVLYAIPGQGAAINTVAPVVNVTGTCVIGAITAFAGGVSATNGASQTDQIDFGQVVWTFGSTWTLVLTDAATTISYTIGAGNIASLTPTFVMPLGNKMYMLSGKTYAFSGINDGTKWEDQDTGAGTVTVSDLAADSTDLIAAASYQGRMALFARRQVQIWSYNADPTLYQQLQVLQNIGTLAKLSVQSVGDLDVLFLSDSGVRSLRVRDSSLNAFVTDIGSPIDQFIVDALINANDPTTACAIVEPTENRYWVYLEGTIYVLSYFPAIKIIAWSTYTPSYATTPGTITNNTGNTIKVWVGNSPDYTQALETFTINAGGTANPAAVYGYMSIALQSATPLVPAITITLTDGFTGDIGITKPGGIYTLTYTTNATTFVPQKFVVYNGRVYCLDTNGNVYVYGGTNNQTYDYSVATAEVPWLDGKKPDTRKRSTGIGIEMTGAWTVRASMDYRTGNSTLKRILTGATVSTPDQGVIAYSAQGTHIKLRAKTVGNTAAVLAALIWHFTDEGEKK